MAHVFICSSSNDRVYAQRLADSLVEQGFDVWLDRSTAPVWRETVMAIWSSHAFITLLSPDASDSERVQREIAVADRRSRPMFPIRRSGPLHPPRNASLFTRWEVLDLAGEDVLPGEKFYTTLAQFCPPSPGGGRYLTVLEPGPLSEEDPQALAQALEDPPPPDMHAAAPSVFEAGQIYKGYEFRGLLSTEGGQGDVYLAYQISLKREVAIKVIKPRNANEPDFIRRFELEAEMWAALEHAHIVPLYDFWRDPRGAFLVMRLMRGGTLRTLTEDQPQELPRVVRWLEQMAGALGYAHLDGIIHRDIKPANILLDEHQTAYLSDFGLARRMDSSDDGGSSGSLGYAAPEQLQGGLNTVQTDLFSLGVVLYELLTGLRAFPPWEANWIERALMVELPDVTAAVPALPFELNAVIRKATAKKPADRYGSVAELLAAFSEALSEKPLLTLRPAPVVASDDAAPLDAPNPYKGLRAFRESDQDDFFGRDALTRRLVERLSEPESIARFLAVVGPSGSGKSSVVKAGLIPALRRGEIPGSQHWLFLDAFPGSKPFEALEAELLRVAVNPPASLLEQLKGENGIGRAVKRILPDDERVELLLVIDQFEELFTLTAGAERETFLTALLAALDDPRSRLRVIVTLRADFYDRPLHYRDFAEMLRKRTEVVLPLSPAELTEAITLPAQRAGARFEPGLAEAIAEEVGQEPGILPLLQYALTELYERRQGHLLTRAAYESLGRVTGALTRRADELFSTFAGEEAEAVRQIFLRLIALGEGSEDTRRRVRMAEVEGLAGVQAVLDAYGKARLITFDRDPETREATLEVTHEALIREWGRLRAWLDASRTELSVQRRLAQEVSEWVRAGHETGLLAGGTRLIQYNDFLRTSTLALTPDERAFIAESLVRQAEEAARLENLVKANRRAARRAATAIVIAIMVGLAAALFTANAVSQQQEAVSRAVDANTQVANAINAQNEAQAREASANTQVANANATLTPIPVTLGAAYTQVFAAAQAQSTANAQAMQSNTQVFFAQATSSQLQPTLTHAAVIIEQANVQQEISASLAEAAIGMQNSFSQQEFDPINVINEMVNRYPDVAYAYLSRGLIYSALREWDSAVLDFDQAIRLDSEEARAYYNRGLATYNKILETSGWSSQTAEEEYYGILEDYNTAINLNPDNIDALLARADILQLYDKKAALADYDRAVLLDPGNTRVYVARAEFYRYYSLDDSNAAIADYTTAIAINPNDASIYQSRGATYLSQGSFEEAIADFSESLRLDPQFNFQAYIGRADAYLGLNNIDAAMLDYAAAINSSAGWGYRERGDAYLELGNLDAALADYSSAIEIALITNSSSEFVYLPRITVYRLQGNYEAALADMRSALELHTEITYLESSLLDFVQQSLEQGNLPDALNICSLILEYRAQSLETLVTRAEVYRALGERDSAAQDDRQALNIDREAALNEIYQRALRTQERGDFVTSIADFSLVIEYRPDDIDAFTGRAKAYLDSGEFDQALADYTQAIALDPESAEVYIDRGDFYADQENVEAALADYSQAITLDPENSRVYNNRGNLYADQEIVEAARADYDLAIRLNPENSLAYNNRGALYARQGNVEAALADYSQAITLDPENSLAYNNRGALYADQGNVEAALEDYSQAITLDPDDPRAYFARGLLYADQGNVEAALADYSQAIALDPEYAVAYFNRGLLYDDQGNVEAALEDFSQVITLDPENSDAYFARGFLYASQRNVEEALADYNQAITLDPENSLAYTNRGLLYASQGNVDAALADYSQAITLDPEYSLAYNNRGFLYARQGNVEAALADYNQAIILDPENSVAYTNRGILYTNQGNVEAALADYNQAITLDPNLAYAYLYRGAVHYSSENIAQAVDDWLQAKQLGIVLTDEVQRIIDEYLTTLSSPEPTLTPSPSPS